MIAFTHLIFGIAVGKVLDLRLGTVMVFSVIPDIDRIFVLAYPMVRNGFLHSLLAGILFSVAAYLLSESISTAKSCFLGYLLHLSLDLLCISGISILYPMNGFYSIGLFSETGLKANVVFLSASAVLIIAEKNIDIFKTVKDFS